MSWLKVVIAIAVTLAVMPPSAAKDAGSPRIDLQRLCRATGYETAELLGAGGQDLFNTCMQDEQAAREQLTKDWATLPALAKARCVQADEYLPGYVEWLVCVEMTRDVIKMRKERRATGAISALPSARHGSDPKVRDCPIVKIGEDGSIDWIIAC